VSKQETESAEKKKHSNKPEKSEGSEETFKDEL
jgi:hypothetical protein